MRFTRTTLVTVLVSVVLLAPAAGRQAGRTMTLDFFARDASGQAVAGLTAADVTLKVGGRERVVHSLAFVALDGGTPPPTVTPAPALPPPYGETEAAAPAGRNVLLLVDEGTLFSLEAIVTDAVEKLLASLGPHDRAGLVSTRPGGVNVGLTTRHAAIRAALAGMVLGRGNNALCIGALLAQVGGLAAALPPGRATTLAVISSGSGSGNPVTSRGTVLSGAGNCSFRTDQLRPVAEAVSATQINYHVFHVGGSGLSAGLDSFAGATGAESAMLSWTDSGAIARAVTSSSRFYRATVDAPAAARGGVERTELRVNRPGVRIVTSVHVTAAPPPAAFADAASLIRGDVVQSDLPVRVAAFASRNDGPQPVKLVVVFEPVAAEPKLASAILSVAGADGEVAGQWTARRTDLARRPMVAAVPVAPGTYRVRVAASDEAGRGGTAEYEIAAVLGGTGGVTMSDMVLGVATEAGFVPRLAFADESSVTAYLEIYGVPPSAPVAATFELSRSLDGPAFGTARGSISAGSASRMVTAIMSLSPVPAGDTLVRARITVDGVAMPPVVCTLRKAGR